jgi:hypothetical protein
LAPLAQEAREALGAADRLSGGGDIGSDLVLLGLIGAPNRVAAQIIERLGVKPAAISEALAQWPWTAAP